MPSFIIVGYVLQILGTGLFGPPPPICKQPQKGPSGIGLMDSFACILWLCHHFFFFFLKREVDDKYLIFAEILQLWVKFQTAVVLYSRWPGGLDNYARDLWFKPSCGQWCLWSKRISSTTPLHVWFLYKNYHLKFLILQLFIVQCSCNTTSHWVQL